jgi:hypothetical protein
MGRVDRQERGRLWAWIYLALFGGDGTECDETETGRKAARDTGDEPAGERPGE